MSHDFSFKRRMHERYRVDWCKIGVTKEHYTKIGYIHDISIGGLSFHYVDNGKGKGEFPNSSLLSILIDRKGFFLEKIPFKTIRDFKIEPDFMEMRQRSVQFGKIPLDQKLHLKYLLENLTAGKIPDKRSGKDRRVYLKSQDDLTGQSGHVFKIKRNIIERRTGMERRT
ncbi:MAG: PilZ domain-containing protein [Desulfobacterales bacterium]